MRGLTLIFMALLLGDRAKAAEPTLKQMDGTWRSEKRLILIDAERMLGSTDDSKPFQRDALTLRDISGPMIVFDIGNKRFIGIFNHDELRLTGAGIEGTETLRRRR